MRIRPVALAAGMLLTLASALIISCSPAPVRNLSENEAIGIARSSNPRNLCFSTKGPDYKHTNFRHTESASFKANGIWVVTARTAWGDLTNFDAIRGWMKPPSDYISDEYPCTYTVDDATGRVTQN